MIQEYKTKTRPYIEAPKGYQLTIWFSAGVSSVWAGCKKQNDQFKSNVIKLLFFQPDMTNVSKDRKHRPTKNNTSI